MKMMKGILLHTVCGDICLFYEHDALALVIVIVMVA